MKRLRFLVVSGPTREPLDPVRFLSNYSTGMMGDRVAHAARKRGHDVTRVRCPEDAETARELLAKLKKLVPKCDVFVMAAAVCDVRPVSVRAEKTKKDDLTSLKLVKNPDVLAALGKSKRPGQVFFGFALESSNLLKNGFRKLDSKKLEALFAQKVTSKRSPFGDTALEAVLLTCDRRYRHFDSINKEQAAELIVREAEDCAAEKAGRKK